MNKIDVIWTSRLSKAPSSSKLAKRCRPSDDDDAHDDRAKRKSRGAEKRGKSELPGADRPAAGPTSLSLMKPNISHTVKALCAKFLFDDISEVVVWAATAAAGGLSRSLYLHLLEFFVTTCDAMILFL
ncbi:hypothetical protein JOM56_011892 [Amanita muscaria]